MVSLFPVRDGGTRPVVRGFRKASRRWNSWPRKKAAPARLREECLTGAEIRAASGTGGTGGRRPAYPTRATPKAFRRKFTIWARRARLRVPAVPISRLACAFRPFARPRHDVIGELVVGQRVLVGDHAAAHRDARRVHALRIAGDERVPPVEVAAGAEQPVGAGRRQPVELGEIFGGQPHAVVDARGAVRVVAAAAGVAVEQAAADVGEMDLAGRPRPRA